MREVSEVVVVVGPSDEDGYCHVEITHRSGEVDNHFIRRDQVEGFINRELDCLDNAPFNDSYHAL